VRELEARLDARFQAVAARFVRVDHRFAATDTHLDELDWQRAVLAERTERRHAVIELRLDSTEAQLVDLRAHIAYLHQRHDRLRGRVRSYVAHALIAYLVVLAATVGLLIVHR